MPNKTLILAQKTIYESNNRLPTSSLHLNQRNQISSNVVVFYIIAWQQYKSPRDTPSLHQTLPFFSMFLFLTPIAVNFQILFSSNKYLCIMQSAEIFQRKQGDLWLYRWTFPKFAQSGKKYIFEEKWHINWLKKRGRTYSVSTDLVLNSANAGGIITGGSYNDTCVRLET